MVKVFFENSNAQYSEQVATFESELIYLACLPKLEELAKLEGFDKVTESTEEEKTFYLIGSDASREYNENGIKAVINRSESNEITFSSFCFIESETTSSELAKALNGWDDYVIITEDEFNQLN